MPHIKILNSGEREVFDFPPIFNSVERKRQVSGFGRNQAPKTDRLNQVPSWEFRNRLKSFTPRQLARILWDFAYLCWANTTLVFVGAVMPGNQAPDDVHILWTGAWCRRIF